MGSLTTPPYTEGVRWQVLSAERLAALTGGGENSREVQGLEGDKSLWGRIRECLGMLVKLRMIYENRGYLENPKCEV